jgi:hypothetical protein
MVKKEDAEFKTLFGMTDENYMSTAAKSIWFGGIKYSIY